MPANGRLDLIQRLKGFKVTGKYNYMNIIITISCVNQLLNTKYDMASKIPRQGRV
jgi:hypothetical protein